MSYLPNIKGIVSEGNSTIIPLGIGATFTGTGELNDFPDVMIFVATDQDGTISAEFSTDGTNWDTSLNFNYVTSRINPPHIFVKGSRYFRIKFENTSGSAQTYLRINTSYGQFNKLTSPINGTVAENYDAILVRPTEYFNEVSLGKRQGATNWQKFGFNLDVDTGGEEIIASFGGTFNIMTTADTLDVVSSSASDGVAGTGARSIQIVGIDENFLAQTEIVTMNGTTPVTTVNSWLGVNRVFVLSSGTNNKSVGNITIDDTLNTVGTQAYILAGQSLTQQMIFHTQINHTFLMKSIFLSALKLSGGTVPRVTIFGYSYSRVTDTLYEIYRKNIDTDIVNELYNSFEIPLTFSGREVIYFTCSTDTDNTAITGRFTGTEQRLS